MTKKPESLLRTGDFIVYRYFGDHLKEDVFLREEIVGKTGLRLTIKVNARRGAQTKTWYQVVIDTLVNRQQNAVEEFYQIIHGKRKRIEFDNQQILASLYEWVLPPSGVARGNPRTTEEDILLPRGMTVPGRCTTISLIVGNREVDTAHCRSDQFPWYHISYTMMRPETADILFAMIVWDWGSAP